MKTQKLPRRLPILEAWDFDKLKNFNYSEYRDQRTASSDRKMNTWTDNLKDFVNNDSNPDDQRGELVDMWYGMVGYKIDDKNNQFKIDRFKRELDHNSSVYGWYDKKTITPEQWTELKQKLDNEGGYRFTNDPVTQGKINVYWGDRDVSVAAYYGGDYNNGTFYFNYDPNFENL